MYDKALQTVRKASCNCYPFTPFSTDPIETKVHDSPSCSAGQLWFVVPRCCVNTTSWHRLSTPGTTRATNLRQCATQTQSCSPDWRPCSVTSVSANTKTGLLQVSLFTAERKLADPCTFRILVKNLTILLPEDDELRQRAYSTLQVC